MWREHTCVEALVAWLLVRVLCKCLGICVGDVRKVAVGAEAFAIVEEVSAVHFAVEARAILERQSRYPFDSVLFCSC